MQKRNAPDMRVRETLLRQCDLVTRVQALAAGLSEEALRWRLRPGGPWRVVLPGIYLSHNGLLTVGQREVAAVLYCGPDSVITGSAALMRHGVRCSATETVDILIPHALKRQSKEFVRVHRTSRMPEKIWHFEGLRWAPPARAVADAARVGPDLGVVRGLVADSVQRGKCTVPQLVAELHAGHAQGSGALRAAIEEVADGVASAAEGDFRKLIKISKLPEPLYNPSLYVGSDFLARPDVWWRDAGVAGELDSREWHLSPADWARTMERHARMSAQGIIVLHFTPGRIRSDASRVIAELRSAIEAGSRRPALPIRTFPHA